MKTTINFRLFFATLFCWSVFLNHSMAQKTHKATFDEVMVVEFAFPFKQIIIENETDEVTLIFDDDSKIINKDKKALNPAQIQPSSIVDVEYELIDGQRVVRKIISDLDDNGIVRIKGLFEYYKENIAYVDGRKVKLGKNAVIEGKKAEKCECKDLLAPSFGDQLIKPGRFFFEIKGKYNDDGLIIADEVEACRNTLSATDDKLRKAVEDSYNTNGLSMVKMPSNLPFKPMDLHKGNIQIGKYSYKLLNNLSIQGYVNSVGYGIIPDHQKELPDGDANKINFRFYVINNPIPNAFAFPNGMIFVHTGILDIMENEAELAIVLGHEIAHVTHEHGREGYESNQKTDFITKIGGQFLKRFSKGIEIPSSLSNSVNEVFSALRPEGIANLINPQPARESQADRVGLQYAYQAGYDIRESVSFWNKMKRLTNEGSFKTKLNDNLKNMLISSDFSYGNPIAQLGDVGFGLLAKMLLETAYTSHPKSKARAQALNQLILSGYKGEDFSAFEKGEKPFRMYLRGEN